MHKIYETEKYIDLMFEQNQEEPKFSDNSVSIYSGSSSEKD